MSCPNSSKKFGSVAKLPPTSGQTASVQALRVLKLREVAKLLDISTVTVRRRVRDGSLAAVRVKGRLYFHPHEIKAFLMKNAEVLWDAPEI